jgi:hypothetical protein
MAAAKPIWPGFSARPLPFSVSREATLPTMVTSRPSRIHTLPRPMRTRQWNFDQGPSRLDRLPSTVATTRISASGHR